MQTETSLVAYQPERAVVKTKNRDYLVSVGNGPVLEFKREIDFGKYGQAKKPSLLKAGAEKIIMAYGLRSVFTTENAIEDYHIDGGFFFYRVRCDLYHRDQLITSGYGSANSREKACGRNLPWDSANQRLKIARKRAMVDAALMIGQLSDMFSQDMENEDFMEQGQAVISNKAHVSGPDDPITPKQSQRLYALVGNVGIGTKGAKEILSQHGYSSAKDVLQKDYDKVCEAIEAAGRSQDAIQAGE